MLVEFTGFFKQFASNVLIINISNQYYQFDLVGKVLEMQFNI
jgi:hypothetical protein